jgi:hypothetical protein
MSIVEEIFKGVANKIAESKRMQRNAALLRKAGKSEAHVKMLSNTQNSVVAANDALNALKDSLIEDREQPAARLAIALIDYIIPAQTFLVKANDELVTLGGEVSPGGGNDGWPIAREALTIISEQVLPLKRQLCEAIIEGREFGDLLTRISDLNRRLNEMEGEANKIVSRVPVSTTAH